MLSPEIIKKIKKVHIKSRRLVNTQMAGQYKSVFKGSGIEFEEVREYSPGDEIKSIDWKVSARLGKPYIKLYREERELVIMLLVDMSASGIFGTTSTTKKETMAEIAAILAFNAIKNNDKVGALLFTDHVEKYIPPKKGSAHVWRLIKEIFSFEPEKTGTDLRNTIQYLGRVCRKRSTIFLISDFLSSDQPPDTALWLKPAGKKHELITVLVDDPMDYHLPKAGIITMQDLESSARYYFDGFDKTTRKQYTKQKKGELQELLASFKSRDLDCIQISTAASAADELLKYFRRREKRKR